MTGISKPKTREIISDFAKEIKQRKQKTVKPSKAVIDFRRDVLDGVERDVWLVPIEILRYRKDNGRITSDVLDHEQNIGLLDERDQEAQEEIRKFLERKDPERTDILKKTILLAGQREPAIVTCDGFLINGNRRKMVMEKLHKEHPEDNRFAFMKVVILPGENEEGGPPSLIEIEKIENHCQLQRDGKAEYYGFDRALSIKRKIELGFSLRAQLADDPVYAGNSKPEMDKAVKEKKREYLDPLECVDRYLKQFRREGLYRAVSAGTHDKEGRWQAFLDYSNSYNRCFCNPKELVKLGLEEDEIGEIEEAAFDVIRLRVVPDMPKVHEIMRKLPKYCRLEEGRRALKKIASEVEPILDAEELLDENGEARSIAAVDAKWAAKYKEVITRNIKKAARSHEVRKETETPLDLLQAAYKKLTHKDMDVYSIRHDDYRKARELAGKIKSSANGIESDIYHCEKELKKLRKRSE